MSADNLDHNIGNPTLKLNMRSRQEAMEENNIDIPKCKHISLYIDNIRS